VQAGDNEARKELFDPDAVLLDDGHPDLEEHGRRCKSLEVHYRQRYCVSRYVSRRPPGAWTARYFRVARYLLTTPRGAYPAWRLLFGVRRVAIDDMDLYSLWGARPSGRKRGRNSCGAFTNRNLRFALTAGARVANALTSPSQILKGV